jgi:hypothetical protein
LALPGVVVEAEALPHELRGGGFVLLEVP